MSNENQTKSTVSQIAKIAGIASMSVIPGGVALTPLLIKTLTKSIEKSEKVAETGSLESLEQEAARQEIEHRITESQARVAQELAIARRIENANEVEIEEFYDVSGDGNLGLRNNAESGLNIGLGGSGRKVKSRVYRFKGWQDGLIEQGSEEDIPHDKNEEDK